MKNILKILHGIPVFIVLILFIPAISAAAARIHCDSPNVDIGSIREGTIKRIRHVFTIKNNGDEPLLINRVKPGWGCTVVEFDSIIPPGQEGKVIQQLKVKKLKSGPFKKTVKVMSNAKNSEVLRLSISGKILSVINISSRFLHLRPDTGGNFSGTLTLNTEKKNLTVKEISFKEHKGGGPEWQQQPILYLKHSVTRTDSADNDGYYTYTLNFSLDITPAKRLSGTFALKTNHPKKDIIDIRGMISPPEEIKK